MRLPGGRRDYGVTPKSKKALVRRLRGSAHIKLFFGPANREEVAGSREILERRSKGWPLAALPARRRICFLFFGSYLYDDRYGEVVLPKPWRIIASLEALTGILMCGLSTGLFFAVVSRWISNWMRRQTALESQLVPPMSK